MPKHSARQDQATRKLARALALARVAAERAARGEVRPRGVIHAGEPTPKREAQLAYYASRHAINRQSAYAALFQS